jgi:GH25 family lysozyme M1 (1,4-beta-N-acetylmuramidase)
MTFDEYFKSVNGKGVDFDGNYGVQCFDLVNDYADKVLGCKPFVGLYAWQIYTDFAAQPSSARFTRIANTPDFVPLKGDIVVWAQSLNGKAGHCAVATGDGDTKTFTSYEQNWTGKNDPCTIVKHDYSHVLGVLRPKDRSNIEKSTAPKAKSTKTHGVDISQYQGTPDFAKLKNAVDFVIIKAGYGRYRNQVDPQFERNYSECKKYGIPCGAYWFGYATNPQDAASEARICAEVLKGKQFEYPIYYDVETDTKSNHYPFNTGIDNCSAMVEAFCSTLESYGYFAGLYISRSPLQQYIYPETAAKYSLWIAEYGGKCNYNGTYGMWQYSDNGSVSGIAKAVDLDECYVDYPALIKSGGFNGYPREAAKPLDTDGYKRGMHDLGIVFLKQRLKVLGYKVDDTDGFGGGTEQAVNKLLTLWGYKPNGIAGKRFAELVMK